MKRRVWRPLAAAAVVIVGILLSTSCNLKREEELRYGMDINLLSPLVMKAVDMQTGERVFSRDPSFVNAVVTLFDRMKLTPAKQTTGTHGIRFTAATMYGNFTFGECWGTGLRMNGEEYTLDKDYSEDIRLLYERIQSETTHIGEVTRETILSVTPSMTFSEVITKFGTTLETAVTGERKALLYQYNNRPFYLQYNRLEDTIGKTGHELMESIWSYYNLSELLIRPEPLEGGRLSAYTDAFKAAMDAYLKSSTTAPKTLVMDTEKLVHLSEEERKELIDTLSAQYHVTITDSTNAGMIAAGEYLDEPQRDRVVLWIEEYSYIGTNRMDFVAAVRGDGQESITLSKQYTLENGTWKG